MAKIKTDEKEVEVADGSAIKSACEELGVLFSCEDGVCGTCLIEVEDGMDNLSICTKKEKNMGIDGNFRLACQCKIKDGEVKIKTY